VTAMKNSSLTFVVQISAGAMTIATAVFCSVRKSFKVNPKAVP
jgi:hypothetical protein